MQTKDSQYSPNNNIVIVCGQAMIIQQFDYLSLIWESAVWQIHCMKCHAARDLSNVIQMKSNPHPLRPVTVHCVLCVSDDVLVMQENQCSSMSLISMMSPSSTAGMSLNMEMPRKRKGSMDNQYAVWLLLINPVT